MNEKDIAMQEILDELRPQFKPGQKVRVITTRRKMFRSSNDDDEISFRCLNSKVGVVTSITGFGNPVIRYEVGVSFPEDSENDPPTIFTPEELKLVASKGGEEK